MGYCKWCQGPILNGAYNDKGKQGWLGGEYCSPKCAAEANAKTGGVNGGSGQPTDIFSAVGKLLKSIISLLIFIGLAIFVITAVCSQ